MRNRLISVETVYITIERRTIPVELKWMVRKTIRVKVERDLTVHVAAPHRASRGKVLEWIEGRTDWIEKKIARLKLIERRNPQRYISGEEHLFCGKVFSLRIILSKVNMVKIVDKTLEIYSKKPDNEEYVKLILHRWFRNEALASFSKSVDRWLSCGELSGIKIPELKVRKMRARWGSCNHIKRSINLNLHLMERSPACVEYVILHELCHLKHPNHSKKFYGMVTKLMPDWKERKKRLEQT